MKRATCYAHIKIVQNFTNMSYIKLCKMKRATYYSRIKLCEIARANLQSPVTERTDRYPEKSFELLSNS